jgi:hypothetical protein
MFDKAPHAAAIAETQGWTFFETQDTEPGEVRKRSFFAVNDATGETHDLDVSPYRTPDLATLQHLIALGFPSRAAIGSIGPLTAQEVELLYLRQRVADLEGAA